VAKRSPARLVVALAIAAVLAVFLLYTALVGNAQPTLSPSKLAGHAGRVSLTGNVIGPVRGDAHGAGLRFGLRDIEGGSRTTVPVVYKGTVPDLFRANRHVVVDGTLQDGVFLAVPGTLVTKCPSKYQPAKSGSSQT
jgi:cytochrome c-type biogenesis protein CcmE